MLQSRPPKRIRQKILSALLLSQFIRNFTLQIINLDLARFVSQEFNQGAVMYGLIIAVFSIFQFLLMVPFSRLSDRIGRKPILIVGLVLYALGSLLCFFSRNYGELFLYRAIQGSGAYVGALMAMINDYYEKDERSKPLTWNQLVLGLGILLGAALGGLILDLFDTRRTFIFVSLLSVASLLVVILETQDNLKHFSSLEQDPHIRTEAWRVLKTNKSYLFGILFFCILWFCFQGIMSYINFLLLNYYQIAASQTAFVLVPIVLAYIAGLILSGRSKSIQKTIMRGYFGVTLVLCFSLFLLVWDNLIFLTVLCATAAIFFGMIIPANDTFISNIVDPKIRGEALGIYTSFQNLMAILSPILTGLIGDIHVLFPFLLMVVLSWIGFLLVIWTFKNHGK